MVNVLNAHFSNVRNNLPLFPTSATVENFYEDLLLNFNAKLVELHCITAEGQPA